MNDLTVIEVGRQSLLAVLVLAGPMLLLSLVVGLTVSIFQAATQINEMTLTFIPKLVAMGAVLMFLLPFMIQTFRDYVNGLMDMIPRLLGS
jgi:flagellar biosynthetic protein FliQ